MVTGEQGAALDQTVAQVIAGVTGGGNGLDRPVRPTDPLTICKHPVWGVAVVKG